MEGEDGQRYTKAVCLNVLTYLPRELRETMTVLEKMRKVLWLQLDYYERNPGLARIIFMTLPMNTWMADETFKQKKMISPLTLSPSPQGRGRLSKCHSSLTPVFVICFISFFYVFSLL